MNSLDNETTIIFPYAYYDTETLEQADLTFNKDYLDLSGGGEILFRLPFEYVQIVYKAMCDKRFESIEDEV